jgi:hypothetical protein
LNNYIITVAPTRTERQPLRKLRELNNRSHDLNRTSSVIPAIHES